MMTSILCLTAAMLALANPGDEFEQTGANCPTVTFTRNYNPPIVIEAYAGLTRGVIFKAGSGGIVWRGGVIQSPIGDPWGTHPDRWAVDAVKATNVVFQGVTFRGAKNSVVLRGSTNFTFIENRFEMGEDGIFASNSKHIYIIGNHFVVTTSKPAICVNGAVSVPMGMNQCKAKGAGWTWRDGWHQDAVQYTDGTAFITSMYNDVDGPNQGIGNMRRTGDIPAKRVVTKYNILRVEQHPATNLASPDAVIVGNTVKPRPSGNGVPMINSHPAARSCGNFTAAVPPHRFDLAIKPCK